MMLLGDVVMLFDVFSSLLDCSCCFQHIQVQSIKQKMGKNTIVLLGY
jgi:hypothetical protein